MIRLARPDLTQAELDACTDVLAGGMLVQGEQCRMFERELAEWFGATDAVLVSSGTAALQASLLALGIGRGDAVAYSDFTFPATANVIELAGARPVPVEVEADSCNMNLDALEQTVSAWRGDAPLRAVIAVHQFGCPMDIDALTHMADRHGLTLIEDAACAMGAEWQGRRIGALGRAVCFSFHPRKSLTTGDGGVIATDDADFAARLRALRNHGIVVGPGGVDFPMPGYNLRMTDFQAAMGRSQLPRQELAIARRRELAGIYLDRLSGTGLELPADIPGHSWQTFLAVLPPDVDRETVITRLREAGVESNRGAYAVHTLSYYRQAYPEDAHALAGGVSERLDRQGLAIPLHAGLSDEEVDHVCGALTKTMRDLRP